MPERAASPRLMTLKPGVELVKALAEAAPTGFVQGSGEVQEAEVRVVGDGAHVRSVAGRATLVSLSGPSAGPLTVCLVRHKEGGSEVVAGTLVRARTLSVHVLVHDVVDSRTEIAGPVLHGAGEAAQALIASQVASGAAPSPDWSAMAAAAAAEAAVAGHAAAEEDEDPGVPEPGDRIQHFVFGLCDVVGGDGERLRIRDLKAGGRVREISTEMLEIEAPSMLDGYKVFRLSRRS